MGQGGIAWSKADQLGGQSRRDRKQARVTAEQKQRADTYRYVDGREGMRCRITGVRVDPYCPDITKRGEHHHIIFRSAGGSDEPENVILVSRWVHDEVHLYRRLEITGNAEERDELGRLNGIVVLRLTESGWQVWKTC